MLHALVIAATLQVSAVVPDTGSSAEPARRWEPSTRVAQVAGLEGQRSGEGQHRGEGERSGEGEHGGGAGADSFVAPSSVIDHTDGVFAGMDEPLAGFVGRDSERLFDPQTGPAADGLWVASGALPLDRLAQPWPVSEEFVVRAQSTYDEEPVQSLQQQEYLTIPPDQQATPWNPEGQVWGGLPMLSPNGGGPVGQPIASVYGANGPQPFRLGWQFKSDVGLLPKERTSNGSQFGVFEFNWEGRYTMATPNQWVLSLAPQFGLRSWNGPGSPHLPAEVFRFGGDVRLTSPSSGPYSFEVGFNPSIGTDFDRSVTRNAWMFDGYGALVVRPSQRYQLLLGALYWDRVNDYILPYAGVVFTPNDVFEIRATFPRGDVSLFLGTPWGIPQWLYVAGEYHIESYEVTRTVNQSPGNPGVPRDQIELEDWRVLLGVRSDANGIQSFLEAGWVFGRQVEFRNATPGFDISSGFIARFGVKF